MLKKFASLMLSLLLCLSLLPGQALAENLPDPVAPSVITAPVEPEDPEPPVMPLGGEEQVPETKDEGHAD